MNTRILLISSLLIVALTFSACDLNVRRGSGDVVSEERAVSGFQSVSLDGIGEMVISQGEPESLVIEAEDNILPLIETTVEDSVLHIGFKDTNFRSNVIPTKVIKYTLTMKDVSMIQLSGAGNIRASSLNTDQLTINSSGAGGINLHSIESNTLKVNLSGAGDCTASGKVGTQEIIISGLGSYKADNLESNNSNITISGAGNASVWAKESLGVTISGAGNVSYYGAPKVTQNISGLGRVKNLGNP